MTEETNRLCSQIMSYIGGKTCSCMREIDKMPKNICYLSLNELVTQYNKCDVILEHRYMDLFFKAVDVAREHGRLINLDEENECRLETRNVGFAAQQMCALLDQPIHASTLFGSLEEQTRSVIDCFKLTPNN